MLLNKATESSFVIAFTEKHVFMVIHSVMSSSSSVHGVFRERILEWFVISSSRGSSWPKDQACISCASYVWGGFFIHWAIREFHQFSSVTQSCLTLCDPMNCSMAGLPVHQLPGWKEQQQSQPVLPCCSKDAFTFSLSPLSSLPSSPTSSSFPSTLPLSALFSLILFYCSDKMELEQNKM